MWTVGLAFGRRGYATYGGIVTGGGLTAD